MWAEMQALDDFKDLRMRLRGALIARESMRNRSLPQPRRDLATEAYCRTCDQMVDLLDRLERSPIVSGSAAKPAMQVLEDMLAIIGRTDLRAGETG